MNSKNTVGSSQGAFAPEPRIYELGYLIMSSVDEGDLGNERDALVAHITQSKGIIIDEAQPVLIDLAYDMDKLINNKKHTFSQAYFGWVKFDMAPSDVEAFTDAVELTPSVLRSIVVKTVRDNTLTSDQPFRLARTTKDEVSEDDDLFVADDAEEGDDLTQIEGIGPVIAKTLSEAGVSTFSALADSEKDEIEELIKGVRGSHDATTWGEQASLARDGKWAELKALQASLSGGKEA